MTDHTPPPSDDAGQPGDGSVPEIAALRKQQIATHQELRRLGTRLQVQSDRLRAALRGLVVCTSSLSAALMVFGSLMKMFVPVSGDDKSLTLYQVLDPEYDPDLLDHSSSWGTGTGWLIPIAMVLVCAVLVVSVAASSDPRALITVTEVFLWCLAIGCVLGFAVLANMTEVVGVPAGLVTILAGGMLGLTACRIARARQD